MKITYQYLYLDVRSWLLELVVDGLANDIIILFFISFLTILNIDILR